MREGVGKEQREGRRESETEQEKERLVAYSQPA